MTNSKLKDSNIEWLGKIPRDWKVKPLYLFFFERKNKNNKGKEKNLLSLSYGKIIQKDINSTGGLLPQSYNTYNVIEAGDIIIRPTDLQNDKHSLRTALSKEHGIITSAYIDLAPLKDTNSEYFHYVLHAYDIEKVFYNMGNGVRQGLNYSEFSKLKLPIPSSEEQKEIVNFLNNQVSQIDKLSKKIRQEITDLEEYRKSIITKAVTKGIDKNVPIKNSGDKMIGEIAASFKLVPLKYVANYNLHTLSDDTNPDFCFKYIDIGSVTTGHINKYQKLRFADAPSRARRLVKNNDIIISTVRTYLKAIAFIQDLQKTTVVSTGFIVLSPKKNLIDPVYLRYAIENESFISKVQAYSVGITYPAINSSTIMNFKLVYPPFNAQKEIASYLDKKCKSINQIIEKKRTLINSLNQYKQSIIYEYVTGKKQVSSEEGVKA